ncbi:MAG: DUF1622 domain-containing protein [Oscillospiraceae bacterium]
MLDDILHDGLPVIITAIELIGISVVTFGSIHAFYHYCIGLFTKKQYAIKYELAESMATGLEFKMAAEILKTVLITDFQELYILGAIILLRALLAFMIHLEIKECHEQQQKLSYNCATKPMFKDTKDDNKKKISEESPVQ